MKYILSVHPNRGIYYFNPNKDIVLLHVNNDFSPLILKKAENTVLILFFAIKDIALY